VPVQPASQRHRGVGECLPIGGPAPCLSIQVRSGRATP
jgi:hypothetical protein